MSDYRGTSAAGASAATFFTGEGGEQQEQNNGAQNSFAPGPSSGRFDIFDWAPAYNSCQKYFLDHAQHEHSVQAVCALVNIRLPFQWATPVTTSRAAPVQSPNLSVHIAPYMRQIPTVQKSANTLNFVSLVPFIRRLVVTGFDKEPVLHGFFGDDWKKGASPIQECERRNYLFSAKSAAWIHVKAQYDMGPQETVPFLQPPQNIELVEIQNAEKLWSQWLAMEDWLVGPRAPDARMEDYA